MTHLLEGLKADKIDELSRELQGEGYKVQANGKRRGGKFDLIASKSGQKIAYAVRTTAEIRDDAEAVISLHHLAREQGYDDFRLKVVSPPRQIAARIDGLEDRLRVYLDEHPTRELERIGDRRVIEEVSGSEIDSIALIDGGSRVAGSAILRLQLLGEPTLDDGADDFRAELPFAFDLELGPDLAIREARIDVDTSEYTGEESTGNNPP